ncbi:MAG: glycoside hydrolase family 9 protein [Hallerella porci]|uniref:Purple acid phosphatase-like protein n=1 Tax=Hallerella porci TaxID=1945871 RepID=A0ABX5LUD3_9BACT|nr:glycoside hydrolase family 9 protein [Hallerella porci]MDY3921214.1 glycoside hydrolase family 9 protein [Hallerella porci]PWL04065.1 purple acid phosphatase-like protein [Hallerella porci]
MRRLFLLLLSLVAVVFADDRIPNIDFTCDTCSRRYLDSLNVYDRPVIRVNQVGFRPADAHKYAFVAEPKATTFKVIDASSGNSVYEGSLKSVGTWTRPNMWVNGAFNSINSVYEFGDNDSTSAQTEKLYTADFSSLTAPGTYFVVVGADTSFNFIINEYLFNAVLETTLKFFGIQRCGKTNSQLHGACHVKDGAQLGHDLTGGWHDCGDHFKVSQTLGYAAMTLAIAYDVYSERAEDHFGASYADTVTTDGIPDILWEAKVGVDFIYKLYKASKEDGLIAKGDMYHSVGVGSEDHQFWDVPEHQDAQSTAKGGAPRPVAKGAGTNAAGMYAAAMAFFAVGWEMYQTDHYSDSLIAAAKDIYKNIIAKNNPDGKNTDELKGFYTGGGPLYDDAAAAALGLWYATKDSSYAFDLYKNPAINNNADNYKYNLPYFKGGYLGHTSGFYPGGWMTDYENVHAYVLFAFAKLILPTIAKAQSYGIAAEERDTLLTRLKATMLRLTDDGTQGDSIVSTNMYGNFKVVPPYNLVWTSSDWGFNRYNMGAANAVFMLYDMTGDEQYLNVALDNFYYNMGTNPWGISFIMGAGTRNENHPHNRASNPDGYNAGALPYEYRCPKGALMGGAAPTQTLKDDWLDYTATETCIDFSSQFIIPGLSLSKKVPEDVDGPKFSNIQGTAISETSAIISWTTDERAIVTVYYGLSPDAAKVDSVTAVAGVGGSVTIDGLTPGAKYYFYLVGHDVKKNYTTDDNHGQWYNWDQVAEAANLSGVTICQVTNNSAKIYWWTGDQALNGIVQYGKSATELSQMHTADSGKVVRFHEGYLTNLEPGTKYYFKVSSGKATSDSTYSFTTSAEATMVDFRVFVKPANKNSKCSDWKTCNTFFVIVTNNDSIPYSDVELRFYLKKNTSATGWGQLVKVSYDDMSSMSVSYGTAVSDAASGAYYLPVTLQGTIGVSSSFQFEMQLTGATYGDLEGSWSLRPHKEASDPERFEGIDLTKGPLYTGSESTFLETVDGKKEIAFTKNPYVTIYYHGSHIYGYAPDYDPASSDLTITRTLTLDFVTPFESPATSLEDTARVATYTGESTVSPSGFLDDFEGNGVSYFANTSYNHQFDDFVFSVEKNLAYGNNMIDWVTWHNHGANAKGSYDCACKVVRSNVEWDSIVTPLEKRFLMFNVDTAKAYIGKRTQVTVTLYDSTGAEITDDDITLALSIENGSAFFYTSPTANIGTTTITLVKGKATFYVSSDTPMETILYASSMTSSSKYNYTSAKAVLLIEELPPWPIISSAKMFDSDCDNIPDQLQMILTSPYQENQKFESVAFEYLGDTIRVTQATITDSLMTVSFTPKNSAVYTNPEGVIILSSNIAGKIEASQDVYTDAISPTVLSLSVLERLKDASDDKVYIQFSEPISAPGTAWPLALFDASGNAVSTVPSVTNSRIYNEELNVWEFTISFDAGGNSIVTEGMKGQLLSNAAITDKAGNGVSQICAAPILPFTLKVLPIPLKYASISDADGDGLAEHVIANFAYEVDEKHAPDSISVVFGTVVPETLWTKNFTWTSDRTEANLQLSSPFKLGNTSGNYSGISSKGGDLIGAGLLMQHKGSGANYEKDSTLAEDLTGPVIVAGTIKDAGNFASLKVEASEPLTIGDSTLTLVQRERSGPINVPAYRWTLAQSSFTMLYEKEAETAVQEGDRIRFAPLDASLFLDNSGNKPSSENPWATVAGSGNPTITFDVHPHSPISEISPTADEICSEENADFRLVVLNQENRKWEIFEKGQLVSSADTNGYIFDGMLYDVEMGIPRGTSIGSDPAWASILLDIDIPFYTNLGAFVNRYEDDFVLTPKYLSTDNKVIMRVQWLSRCTRGIVSTDGRALGTGAYIAKIDIDAKFIPNENLEKEVQARFSSKDSYTKTQTFGIRRVK